MRFVPTAAEPYLRAVEDDDGGGALPRRAAVQVIVGAYTSWGRLLTGLALWLAVAAAVVVAAVGALAVADTVVGSGSTGQAVGGGAAVAAALVGGTWAALAGRDLLRAGARLSRAAEVWMTRVPAPRVTMGHAVHGLLSSLRPELYPRIILSSLAALGAVLCASAVGFSVAQLPGPTPVDTALNAIMAPAAAALAALCAVPAVALWRGSGRVQRGLVKDPTATG